MDPWSPCGPVGAAVPEFENEEGAPDSLAAHCAGAFGKDQFLIERNDCRRLLVLAGDEVDDLSLVAVWVDGQPRWLHVVAIEHEYPIAGSKSLCLDQGQ